MDHLSHAMHFARNKQRAWRVATPRMSSHLCPLPRQSASSSAVASELAGSRGHDERSPRRWGGGSGAGRRAPPAVAGELGRGHGHDGKRAWAEAMQKQHRASVGDDIQEDDRWLPPHLRRRDPLTSSSLLVAWIWRDGGRRWWDLLASSATLRSSPTPLPAKDLLAPSPANPGIEDLKVVVRRSVGLLLRRCLPSLPFHRWRARGTVE
jgi:hypothetical protein